MKIDYVPLLQVQRDLHNLPRNYERFLKYLSIVLNRDRTEPELPPLLAMNPMGKDHVTALLNAYLALDADGIAAQAVTEAAAQLVDVPGDLKATLVIADDLMGGWTNRYANEFTFRFQALPVALQRRPRWLKHLWVTGILWSSETATAQAPREVMLTAIYRLAYVHRHGPARTLREKLAQEGHVMALAGCTAPVLDEDDIAYTREVLTPFLDADDMRTNIECLFGDAAGRTLGFTPRGLSPWAGLALALHNARRQVVLMP